MREKKYRYVFLCLPIVGRNGKKKEKKNLCEKNGWATAQFKLSCDIALWVAIVLQQEACWLGNCIASQ